MTELSAPALETPVRILVVNDEPATLQLIEQFLDGPRFQLTRAIDAEEGLRQFLAGAFDVVISDRDTPATAAAQLAFEIKRHAPTVPIILLTTRDAAVPFDTTPFDAFLPKPFTRTQLVATVDDVWPGA